MDSVLVKQAIAGDIKALSQLIDKYKDSAYSLAISIVKDRESAKDITQDSFIKVLENINRFRNESSFSTWLYRIVYNESLKHLQSNKAIFRDIESVKSYIDPDSSENSGDEDETPEVNLQKAINRLENNERNIVILFYMGEKSIRETETITGLSISNIKVILHRSRKKLKEYIQNNYEKI
jgi:RNA polymerase sigma-70 factor (ECF subfamily)